MKRFPISIPFFALLFVCSWRLGLDYWWSKWSVGLGLAAIIFGVRLAKNLKCWSAGALFSWVIISGLFVFSWRYNQYQIGFSDCDQRAINESSAYSTCAFLIIFLICSTLTPKMISKTVTAFGSMCLISSILTIVHYLRGSMSAISAGGFFDQASMEGTFIAITYPMLALKPYINVAERQRYKFQTAYETAGVFLPIIAVALLCAKADASQPLVVLAAVLCLYILRDPYQFYSDGMPVSFSKKSLYMLCFYVLCIALVFGYQTNTNFFYAEDRAGIYKMAWEFLVKRPIPFVIGTGTGTYMKIGPSLQEAYKIFQTDGFLWIHSDWLQTLFENGIIGLILLAITGVTAFLRAWKSEMWWAAISLAAYGAAMIFNFPFHLPVHAFLGMFLLMICLNDSHKLA